MSRKQYVRVRGVAERYDVVPSTIWRWANDKRYSRLNFPKPKKPGPNTSAWDEDELDAYDALREAVAAEA